MTVRRRLIAAIAALLCTPSLAFSAPATDYPTKPMKFIVPYPPGGATDLVARQLAAQMAKTLGQQAIVENKPGANAIIASQFVSMAPPDGYTILISSSSNLVLNPLLYKKLPYNPDKDLAPVALFCEFPMVMVVNSKFPAKTVSEFVSYAKSHPGTVNFASPGIGNSVHLAAELFMTATGANMTNVPFSGSAPALLSLLAGDVHVYFDIVNSAIGHIKTGKLRALGVTTLRSIPVLPDVPTIADSGYPGFEVSSAIGITVPKKTPPAVVARLNEAVNKILLDKGFRNQLESAGLIVAAPNTPEQYAELIRKDSQKWGEVIKAKNISLD